jgi:hypothetical protein
MDIKKKIRVSKKKKRNTGGEIQNPFFNQSFLGFFLVGLREVPSPRLGGEVPLVRFYFDSWKFSKSMKGMNGSE